jgi:hypothetical protein
MQRSKATIAELSARYGLNPKTVATWRKRDVVADAPMRPKEIRTLLTDNGTHFTRRGRLRGPADRSPRSRPARSPAPTPSIWPAHAPGSSTGVAEPPLDRRPGRAHDRTLKEATVRRFHCESHDPLRAHPADFLNAYTFAKCLETLRGNTLRVHLEAMDRRTPAPSPLARPPHRRDI